MTQILQQAWNSVINLPEDRQELIAHLILDEIHEAKKWDIQFERTQDKLSLIANKVRSDISARNIQKNGFGEL